MQAYLLSAAGVIFLSVVVSLLVPEGKLNKTITFVMRIICILVLIQPITGIFKPDNSADTVSGSIADYEYVCGVYSKHQSEQMEKLILSEFGAESECNVEVDYSDGAFKVVKAEVKLKEKDGKLIETIYEYLQELGYINISVYAEST